MSTPAQPISVGGRSLRVTHPDKRLFGADGPSKLELTRYYEHVAPWMLRHLEGRPLALESFPRGIGERGFFMKSVPGHFPDWVERVEVSKRGGSLTQVLGSSAATLAYLASQNVIAIHTWLSRAEEPRRPDRLIIDLDPADGVGFAEVRATARDAGERLRDAGLHPYAMVTGSRGLHVVCPLRQGPSYPEAHRFARAVADAMVKDTPDRVTLEWHRAARGQRIYLDVNRVAYAQHGIAPYGVRAKPAAPVAMPIHWEELSDRNLRPDGWTLATAPKRLDTEGDAWSQINRHARKLRAAQDTG